MELPNYTELQFDLYIRRTIIETGYPGIIHIRVKEKIAHNSSFYDELTRIGKKYSIGPYVTFVFLDEKIFYSDLFSEDLCSKIDLNLFYDAEPLRILSGKLIGLFNLQNKPIPLGINYPDRGETVGTYDGMTFYFHTRESNKHHEKHIHCMCQGENISIQLDPVKILSGKLRNRKKEKLALQIVEKYKDEFIYYWDTVIVNGEPFKLKLKFDI